MPLKTCLSPALTKLHAWAPETPITTKATATKRPDMPICETTRDAPVALPNSLSPTMAPGAAIDAPEKTAAAAAEAETCFRPILVHFHARGTPRAFPGRP